MNKIPQHFLVNFMGMPKERRYNALKSFHLDDGGFWGYGAFLKAVSEILSTEVGLFGELPEISDEQLAILIKDGCSSGNKLEYHSNLKVAKLLKKFVADKQVASRRIQMPYAKFGSGEYLRFWHDIIVEIDGHRYVLCVDPKISGLTKAGQKVVASLAQTVVIDDNAKLTGFKTGILNFPKTSPPRIKPAVREPSFTDCSSEDLFTYEDLRKRYIETYTQYAQVIEDIRRGTRASGTSGSLL